MDLSDAPLSTAAVSTVVRTHRMCRSAGAPLAVVATTSETRRTLGAQTSADGLDVQSTRSLAVAALADASAPVAAAA
ncbi:hypothetical protein ACFYYB_27860 [Streptomyces sp. NPDC002886]|uniref:hypothetical protein n=1 Tax=Streptomyces sp. NPDC002886 TaxID=3364667 RepID=UPI0036AA6DD6